MIFDFKIFSVMLLRMETYLHVLKQLSFGVLSVYFGDFTFITKKKLHFSLIYSIFCCLVKEGRALKVA